ncbi:MAG TPA: hypothetical protein PLV92_30330 [Pirellulaceae bacterium]|nr:hypothetical protein [Pirellulaceae bacterium]
MTLVGLDPAAEVAKDGDVARRSEPASPDDDGAPDVVSMSVG